MSEVRLISQSAYARLRGVSKSAVARAVRENRISLIDGKIDPAVADIQWQQNTRARVDSGVATTEQALGLTGEAAAPAPPSEPDEPSGYSFDRGRREKYEADLAEMKLLELRGELVRADEVRAEMAKAIGQLRTNLLQIAARLAPALAAESDQAKVHELIDAEIRGALHSTVAAPRPPP